MADSEGAVGEDQRPRAWRKRYSNAASGRHDRPRVSEAFLQHNSNKLPQHKQPHCCCHLPNNFDSRQIFPILHNRPGRAHPHSHSRKNCPFPLGIQASAYYMVPWTHLSPHPKQHQSLGSLVFSEPLEHRPISVSGSVRPLSLPRRKRSESLRIPTNETRRGGKIEWHCIQGWQKPGF